MTYDSKANERKGYKKEYYKTKEKKEARWNELKIYALAFQKKKNELL